MINSNLPRWIITSVNKHFDDRKEDIILFLNANYEVSKQDFAELRFSGPTFQEFTTDDIKCTCIINILLTSYVAEDAYKIYRMIGIIVKAFTPICVYRYGDGPEDDQSLVGTLQSIEGKTDVVDFGIIPESEFYRSFVEDSYYMIL